ncbi:Hypothetical predicted protein [Podarcis lilfordi]|uniref:Uncharacterized protein n=1 Tax=Podarcis lilfordi TaxID=74358 RepID=A0AA35JQN5_9SAUR|nr:Hypothetical predicted protein [Podarcis lilfordi]
MAARRLGLGSSTTIHLLGLEVTPSQRLKTPARARRRTRSPFRASAARALGAPTSASVGSRSASRDVNPQPPPPPLPPHTLSLYSAPAQSVTLLAVVVLSSWRPFHELEDVPFPLTPPSSFPRP